MYGRLSGPGVAVAESESTNGSAIESETVSRSQSENDK